LITLSDIRNAMKGFTPAALSYKGKRRAAVAVILRENTGGTGLLFIERSKREDDPWSGHLAFPGGQVEVGDLTLRDTAERETLEEIGLDVSAGEYLGRLDDITGSTVPVVVSGFVFIVNSPVRFTLNYEVQDAFWFALDDLADVKRHTRYRFPYEGSERTAPAIDLLGPGRPVLWGLTYRFVSQLLGLVGREIP